jgi:hypothetical protein
MTRIDTLENSFYVAGVLEINTFEPYLSTAEVFRKRSIFTVVNDSIQHLRWLPNPRPMRSTSWYTLQHLSLPKSYLVSRVPGFGLCGCNFYDSSSSCRNVCVRESVCVSERLLRSLFSWSRGVDNKWVSMEHFKTVTDHKRIQNMLILQSCPPIYIYWNLAEKEKEEAVGFEQVAATDSNLSSLDSEGANTSSLRPHILEA